MATGNEAAALVLLINQLPPEYKINGDKLSGANPNIAYRLNYGNYDSISIPVYAGMFITDIALNVIAKFTGTAPTLKIRKASDNSIFADSTNFSITRLGVQKVSIYKPIIYDDALIVELSSDNKSAGEAYLSLIKGQLV